MNTKYYPDYPSVLAPQQLHQLYKAASTILNIDASDFFNYIYVPIHNGLGDAIPAIAFSKKLSELHNIPQEKIFYVVADSKVDLIDLFDINSFQFKVVDDKFIPRFAPFNGFGYGKFIFSSKAYIMQGSLAPLMYAHSIPFVDIIKACFKVPLTTSFESPLNIIEDDAISEYAELKVMIKSNKPNILLFPYSSFGARIDIKFWETIASILLAEGFSVFTNISNNTQASILKEKQHNLSNIYAPVKGTIPLKLSLNLLSYLFHRFPFIPIHSQGGIAYLTALLPSPKRIMIYQTFSNIFHKTSLTSSTSATSYIFPNDKWDSVENNLPGMFETFYFDNIAPKNILKSLNSICK